MPIVPNIVHYTSAINSRSKQDNCKRLENVSATGECNKPLYSIAKIAKLRSFAHRFWC